MGKLRLYAVPVVPETEWAVKGKEAFHFDQTGDARPCKAAACHRIMEQRVNSLLFYG